MVTQNDVPESPTIVISSSEEATLFPSFKEKTTYEMITVKINTPNFSDQTVKSFEFRLDEKIWKAKQNVLIEFATNTDLRDPLNFGFYMPPEGGRAGKFLNEERLLKEYPMDKDNARLEFRYKRRIFRHLQLQDEKRLQKINTKKYRKKFVEYVLTKNFIKLEKMLMKGLDPNFHDDKTGDTPLIIASMLDGCMALLKLLVQHGAYIDFRSQDGVTALHKIAVIGKIESIKNLLDLGASPNCKDSKGVTPLYLSILSGANPIITEILLRERSEIGIRDLQGSEEIHQACKLGYVQHLEHLIFYGANVNAATASGNTPLHICGLENQESCARVLLFRGANRNVTNYAQQSAYDVAILANNFEISQLINEFDDSEVRLFSEEPEFTKRRSNTIKKQETSSSLPSSPTQGGGLIHAVSTPNMHTLGLVRARKGSLSSLPDHKDVDSGSDTDSDDEDLKPMKQTRTFSHNAGVGTKRSPAPMKKNNHGASTLRTRLYASVPGRSFVAITDYEPAQQGELSLKKGDIVEVLYVGEGGFWEGSVNRRAGWFPSYCVQEVNKGDTFKSKQRSWFGRKNSPMDVINKAMQFEAPKPKVVSLKRQDRGFGFQLRGANSHVPHIEFNPSPQFPALQYIGEVDKGGVAEKAGLRPGDFVLEINNEDVSNATHGYAVSLISKGGKHLSIKVITVAPESIDPDLLLPNGTLRSKGGNGRKEIHTNESKKVAPPPPTRSTSTILSQFSRENSENSVFSEGAVAVTAETVVLEKPADRKQSVKGMWAGNAYRLQGEDIKVRDDDISGGISRKTNGPSHDLAAEFDEKFKIITKQVNVDVSRCPVVQPKPNNKMKVSSAMMYESTHSNSSSSLSSMSSSNSQPNEAENRRRKPTPPGYDYTIESLRRGRANSLGRGDDARPKTMSRAATVDLDSRYDDATRSHMLNKGGRAMHYSPPDVSKQYQDRHSMYVNAEDMAAYQQRRNMMVEQYLEDQQFSSLRRLPRSYTGILPGQSGQRQRDSRSSRPVSEFIDRDYIERQRRPNMDPRVDKHNCAFQQNNRTKPTKDKKAETVLETHQRKLFNPDTDYRSIQELSSKGSGCREPDMHQRRPVHDGLTRHSQSRQADGLVQIVNIRQPRLSSHDSPSQTNSNVSAPVSNIPPPPPPPPMPTPPPDYLDDAEKHPAPPNEYLHDNSNGTVDEKDITTSSKSSSNVFADSILNAVAARSTRSKISIEQEIEKNKVKKDSDSDSVGSFGKHSLHSTDSSHGSESLSLYNSSSSVSLDSACSKDSGFENSNDGIDHSSALAQAIALRAAKMATKDHNINVTSQLPSTKEVPEPEKSAVEETNLIKPSDLVKKNQKSQDLNHNELDKGYSSPTSSRSRAISDIAPTTKPKPKRANASEASPDQNNNKSPLSEDSATSYLDGVIADAEASIDYDLISITSRSSSLNEKDKRVKPMRVGSLTITNGVDRNIIASSEARTQDEPPSPSADLPPPPDDFLEDAPVNDVDAPDCPPSYTERAPGVTVVLDVPSSLTNKSYMEWSTDDVGLWLDYLSLSQYRGAFLENDIEGKHLVELSKNELKELGVTKLGHRMTLDDAIGKICRSVKK